MNRLPKNKDWTDQIPDDQLPGLLNLLKHMCDIMAMARASACGEQALGDDEEDIRRRAREDVLISHDRAIEIMGRHYGEFDMTISRGRQLFSIAVLRDTYAAALETLAKEKP